MANIITTNTTELNADMQTNKQSIKEQTKYAEQCIEEVRELDSANDNLSRTLSSLNESIYLAERSVRKANLARTRTLKSMSNLIDLLNE